jgi:hypothetical protein
MFATESKVWDGKWAYDPTHIPLVLSLAQPSPLFTFSLERGFEDALCRIVVYPGYASPLEARDFAERLQSLLDVESLSRHGRASRLVDILTILLLVHNFMEESTLVPVLQSLAVKCPKVFRLSIDFISQENLVRNYQVFLSTPLHFFLTMTKSGWIQQPKPSQPFPGSNVWS